MRTSDTSGYIGKVADCLASGEDFSEQQPGAGSVHEPTMFEDHCPFVRGQRKSSAEGGFLSPWHHGNDTKLLRTVSVCIARVLVQPLHPLDYERLLGMPKVGVFAGLSSNPTLDAEDAAQTDPQDLGESRATSRSLIHAYYVTDEWMRTRMVRRIERI